MLQESKDEKGALDYSFTITSEPCQASVFAQDISTPAGHLTTQSPNESNSCFGKWWNSLLGDNCSEKSANENVDTVLDDYDVPLCTWCAWTNSKDTLKDEEEDVNSDDNLSLSNSYSGSLISVESSTMSYDGTQTLRWYANYYHAHREDLQHK